MATEREETAANNQIDVARYNAESIKNQLNRQLNNYNMADLQNERLAEVQQKQNNRKIATDRFEADRALQNAALYALNSLGNPGLNGSALYNYMTLLRSRNDYDNNINWQQKMDNNNQVLNALAESRNANNVAADNAAINAERAARDAQSYLSADLGSINSDLYVSPGTGDADLSASEVYTSREPNYAQLAGYVMPENAEQNIRGNRNKLNANSYFNRLVNRFNNIR